MKGSSTHGKNNESPHRDQEIHGLRIRNMNYGFIVVLAVLAIVLFVVTVSLSRANREVTEIGENYHEVEENAAMVQSASDDLTKDVEFFVMTGEKRYMDDYFIEANVTKRREKAVDNLRRLRVTDSMFTYLEDAVKESVDLMQLEYQAMRYASEGFGLDISNLLAVVQNTKLPKPARTMSAGEKIDQAHKIVFGDDYVSYKNRISGYEKKYTEEAIGLMKKLQDEGHRRMRILLVTQWIAVILIVILGSILFITISRMVVRPLGRAVSTMARGEKISPLNGIYEIQYMAHSYNGFQAQTTEAQKRLKHDAERDALTGALNRRGYETVVDKLSAETFPLALLVFDVDNFKYVNDNYGHEAGDKVLGKLAKLLQETFQTANIISRIGGDEFTVILLDTTEEEKTEIAEKIRSINEALRTPGEENCPAFTVSVGCAFSPAGYNSYSFAQADANMYNAKRAGGGDIRFS